MKNVSGMAIRGEIEATDGAQSEFFGERRNSLKEILADFEKRAAELPKKDREALLSMYYRDVIDVTFHFHGCAVSLSNHRQMQQSESREKDLAIAAKLRCELNDLARLYKARASF